MNSPYGSRDIAASLVQDADQGCGGTLAHTLLCTSVKGPFSLALLEITVKLTEGLGSGGDHFRHPKAPIFGLLCSQQTRLLTAGLVVGSVTTSESPVLYVSLSFFVFLFTSKIVWSSIILFSLFFTYLIT